MSGLENGDKTAVAKTSVSPQLTKQEPEACSVQLVVLITIGVACPELAEGFATFISNVSFTAIILAAKYGLVRIYQKVLEP